MRMISDTLEFHLGELETALQVFLLGVDVKPLLPDEQRTLDDIGELLFALRDDDSSKTEFLCDKIHAWFMHYYNPAHDKEFNEIIAEFHAHEFANFAAYAIIVAWCYLEGDFEEQ